MDWIILLEAVGVFVAIIVVAVVGFKILGWIFFSDHWVANALSTIFMALALAFIVMLIYCVLLQGR